MQLKEWRLLTGLTLDELAGQVGEVIGLPLSVKSVQRHETGERFPRPEFIEAYRALSKGAVRYEDFHALRVQLKEVA